MFPSTPSSSTSSHSSSVCPPVFGSQTGMSPLSFTTTFGTPSYSGFGSSTALGFSPIHPLGSSSWTSFQGPQATKTTFNLKQANCGCQERGSRIADYKKTADKASSAEKLVSISAMPVYKTKSHEELRWEGYNFSGKCGFGLSSSLKSTTSSVNKISWETTTKSPTWKYPCPASTWFTSKPTVSAAPSNSFNQFAPKTSLTSTTVSAPHLNSSFNHFVPSFSHPTFPTTPSSTNAICSTPITGPSVSTVTATEKSVSVSPGLNLTYNQPTTLDNPFVPSTQNCNTGTIIGQISASQLSLSQITTTEQPTSAVSPFGTLPPKPQMVFQSTQSIQYGISSIPVKDKPAPVRYPLLTTRHLSSRSKLPVRKYDPKLIGPKIPFFDDTEEIPVDVFVPRENPRALLISPKMWQPRAITKNMLKEKFPVEIYENERDDIKAYACSDDPTNDEELRTTILSIPLKHPQADYYTEPQISELEAKERADPGFCRRVKDFVVGRHGYGSIKFIGETDVRNVDLESHVQFNNGEVIVYMDDTKKPPVGEGLNKPAEITLLNIKCIDKKTGMQYVDGSKMDKYIQLLKKKGVAQGVEFMSYDPIEGEWKFRVQHF